MEIPTEEKLIHDWVIRQVEHKHSSLYNEIRTNPEGRAAL